MILWKSWQRILEYFDSVTPEGAGTLRLHGSIFLFLVSDIDSQTLENVVKYINPRYIDVLLLLITSMTLTASQLAGMKN